MEVISLDSLLKASEKVEDVYEYLSSFKCEKNPDVESFLHEQAISSEQRSFSRTSLVIDTKNQNKIIGYFTLLVKNFSFSDVSGSARQKLTGNKRAPSFMTILIAQLGRSDLYKGRISGKQVLDLALENCKMINLLSAVRLVCVEYDDNVPQLESFYEINGFTPLQRNDNGYIISYVRI